MAVWSMLYEEDLLMVQAFCSHSLSIVQTLWGGVSRLAGKHSMVSGVRTVVARHIFGSAVEENVHLHLWDETSLVLRKAIGVYAEEGQRVLDLGTGQAAILSIYCTTLRDVEAQAVDVNDRYLVNAKSVAMASGCANIRFSRSDWFSAVHGSFDLIWANIPYVPKEIA